MANEALGRAAKAVLDATSSLSAQASRLYLAILAGYDKNDIDGLSAALSCSPRSVYRWLSELSEAGVLDGSVTPQEAPRGPVDVLIREARVFAEQVMDLAGDISDNPVTKVAQPPLSPHTPHTPENLTSPPPIVPPRRKRTSKPNDQEMALVAAIVEECNRLWNKRFSPQAHADYIVRRIRRFPDVTLDEHLEIVRSASANPWWSGEPSPRVIYSRDDLFDSMRQPRGTAPRVAAPQDREARQRELLGEDIFTTLEASSGRNGAHRRPAGIALAGHSDDQG